MTMKIELIGDKDFEREIQKIKRNAPQLLDAGLAEMAFDVHQEAIEGIQRSPASGRTYKRRTITHIASSPRNPPRTDTGNLIKNITVEREGKANYTVGSRKGAPYGLYLEFGTASIKKRPWLTPAYLKVIKDFKRYFTQ